MRDLFEQVLAEVGIELPAPELAQRYALRRLAMRLIDEDLTLTVLVRAEWEEAPVATEEERALVALIPPCLCCLDYTLPVDQQSWLAALKAAASALLKSPPIGPDVAQAACSICSKMTESVSCCHLGRSSRSAT